MAVYLGTNKVNFFGGDPPPGSTPTPTITLQSKVINPSSTLQTISADSGYDGLSQITINPVQTETKTISANGTYTPTSGKYFSSVSVSMPSVISNQNKTVSPSTSSQSITADGGYTGLGTVTVNAMPALTLPTAATTSATSGYTLKATINRSTSDQYINIPTGYNATTSYYKITKTPNGSVTAPSSISGTGASVTTGTNTLTFTKSVSVTPNVTTAGYISAGTAGNSSVSLTAPVTTKGAATYTPTTSNQIIAASQYLTGAQTIQGDANLIARNIKKDTSIFGVTGTYSGPEDDVTDAVRFFDYDGTILYSYSAAQFLALSSMPANPSHTGLVAQGWNWTLADAKAHVTDWGFLDIGQMYTTSSGLTEIDIELYKGRLAPYLGLGVNGEVSINWGDGSAVTSLTGTSLTTQVRTQHTYANAGNYTIKITIVSGSFAFYGSTTYYLLNANNSSSNYNRVYANCVRAVRIGSGNIALGQYAFYYCTSLQYVTLPNSLLSLNSSLFRYCYSLKTITIPTGTGSLSTISSYNFNCCYSLSLVSLTKQITTVAGFVFTSCYSLDALILPSSVTSLSNSIYDIDTLTRLDRLIIPCQDLKIIAIKNYNIDSYLTGLTTIPNYKFSYINQIKTASISSTITQINQNAFQHCRSLTSVTLPSTDTTLSNGYQFNCCYSLHTITNFDKATLGSSYTLASCYSLSSPIVCKSSLTSVPTNLFNSCYCLRSITLPSGITNIPSWMAGYCYCLPTITIPSGVTNITSYSFYQCYGLTSITIPSNVTSIETYSFNGCYGLGEIHVQATTPPTLGGTSAFTVPADCTIYVPSASLATYQAAQYWSTWASQMVGE